MEKTERAKKEMGTFRLVDRIAAAFSTVRKSDRPHALSDHFNGRRFHNQVKPDRNDVVAFFKWIATRRPGPWTGYREVVPGPVPEKRVQDGRLRVTHVNHSTVLIQTDGQNILTDPIWSTVVSPIPPLGIGRKVPPGIRFEDLPPIDIVLLSHDHYDHLDLPTLRRLERKHRPLILAGLGTTAYLAGKGLARVTDLDWWESHDVSDQVRVHAVPAAHFSGRSPMDFRTRLWCGFVVQGPSGSIYFAGDTGWGDHIEQIGEKFGPARLALLPIGAYLPTWFMGPVHISPAQAVAAHQLLGARTSLGIHHSTFRLADDGQFQPGDELQAAVRQAGLSEDDFWVLDFGHGRDAPPSREPDIRPDRET